MNLTTPHDRIRPWREGPTVRVGHAAAGTPIPTILSWDKAPSARFEQLVQEGVARFSATWRLWRFRVWVERRPETRGRYAHHVRLDVELASANGLQSWELRAENTGPSAERSLLCALRAIATLASHAVVPFSPVPRLKPSRHRSHGG